MAWPDFEAEIDTILGGGTYDDSCDLPFFLIGDNTANNPAYTLATFRTLYPQFPAALFPDAVVQNYITTANGQLSVQVWGASLWPQGMGLLTAHYLTRWAQSQTPGVPTTLAQAVAGGAPVGFDRSQSADGLSYSTDYPLFGDGWGSLGLTSYGQDFLTWAQIIGTSSMLIY